MKEQANLKKCLLIFYNYLQARKQNVEDGNRGSDATGERTSKQNLFINMSKDYSYCRIQLQIQLIVWTITPVFLIPGENLHWQLTECVFPTQRQEVPQM